MQEQKISCTSELNYFGMVAEKMDKTVDSVEISFTPGENTRFFFIRLFPQLAAIPFQVAIDLEISESFPNKTIQSIALLPPFAGG